MKQESGFSLIETLIAISILGIGLLAVAGMQVSSIQQNSKSQMRTVAAMVGQSILENLLLLPYDETVVPTRLPIYDADGDGGADLFQFGHDNNDATQGDADYFQEVQFEGFTYDVFWNISEDDPVVDCKRIGLIVQWEERGQTHRIQFEHTKVL